MGYYLAKMQATKGQVILCLERIRGAECDDGCR